MAIAFDNAASYTFVNPSGNSTSFTMSSASGGVIMLCTSFNVTAATYNGVSFTQYLHYEPSIHDGNQQQINVYTLFNPASGSNTLAITTNGNSGTLGIVSYTGVEATGNPETYITGFSNNGVNNTQVGSLSSTVTTITDNSWSVMFSRGGNNLQDFVIGGGAGAIRTTGEFIFGDGTQGIYDSNGAITPAGNSTLTATWNSSSGFISNVIVSLKPFVYTPIKGTMAII